MKVGPRVHWFQQGIQKISVFRVCHTREVSDRFFYGTYPSSKLPRTFLEGGRHRNTHHPPRATAPNTENHPKQLFSRGSVKKICRPVGCRSIGYFGGICCKNVRRIFLEGGRHRITPHPPSSRPRKVGEMWVFGAQGRKTAPPPATTARRIPDWRKKTAEGLRKNVLGTKNSLFLSNAIVHNILRNF